jgi:hypothetical protein
MSTLLTNICLVITPACVIMVALVDQFTTISLLLWISKNARLISFSEQFLNCSVQNNGQYPKKLLRFHKENNYHKHLLVFEVLLGLFQCSMSLYQVRKNKAILPLHSSNSCVKIKKIGSSATQLQCEGRTLFGRFSLN